MTTFYSWSLVAFNMINLAIKGLFLQGNQIYHSSGQINNGVCSGDKITMLSMSIAKKGSCKARSGVQQSMSEVAMLTITGKCQSQCFGDVNVVFSPGLRY